jgi:DNA-directed RNA polymerase I, II, and III subunit RPABC1
MEAQMEVQMDYETEQSRKLLLPKLFRVWKTLHKMMEDRGYTIDVEEQNYSKMTFQEWHDRYKDQNNKLSFNGIFAKKIDENVTRLYYQYIPGTKLTANDISLFFSQMKEGQCESGIIIISGQLSPQAKQKLEDINVELQVECFNISELMVNITEHEYVPKHLLLTPDEKKQLLKRYKIKENQLPKILKTDPVAKYLGLKKGDVVKIIRDSETAGKYVTYRITV